MTNIRKHFHLKNGYYANLALMQSYIEENNFNHAIYYYLNSLIIADEIIENFYEKLTHEEKYYIEWL